MTGPIKEIRETLDLKPHFGIDGHNESDDGLEIFVRLSVFLE